MAKVPHQAVEIHEIVDAVRWFAVKEQLPGVMQDPTGWAEYFPLWPPQGVNAASIGCTP